MKTRLFLVLITFFVFVLTACGPNFYLNEKLEAQPPKVVLILPPENMTSSAEVEEKLYPILYDILSNRGYYCLSIELVKTIFEANKLNDAGRINQLPNQKFKEIFAAGAVLRTRVTEWAVSYVVISSSVTVGLDMELIDTQSGEILWSMQQTYTQSSNSSGGGLIGALVSAAISTAAFEYEPIAEENSKIMFKTIPEGPYYEKW